MLLRSMIFNHRVTKSLHIEINLCDFTVAVLRSVLAAGKLCGETL